MQTDTTQLVRREAAAGVPQAWKEALRAACGRAAAAHRVSCARRRRAARAQSGVAQLQVLLLQRPLCALVDGSSEASRECEGGSAAATTSSWQSSGVELHGFWYLYRIVIPISVSRPLGALRCETTCLRRTRARDEYTPLRHAWTFEDRVFPSAIATHACVRASSWRIQRQQSRQAPLVWHRVKSTRACVHTEAQAFERVRSGLS